MSFFPLAALNLFPNEQRQWEYYNKHATSCLPLSHARIGCSFARRRRFRFAPYPPHQDLVVSNNIVEPHSGSDIIHTANERHNASNMFASAPHLPDLLCAPAQASNVGRAERKKRVRFLKPNRRHLIWYVASTRGRGKWRTH